MYKKLEFPNQALNILKQDRTKIIAESFVSDLNQVPWSLIKSSDDIDDTVATQLTPIFHVLFIKF